VDQGLNVTPPTITADSASIPLPVGREGFEVDRTAEGGVSLRRKTNAAKESYWFKKPVDPVADGVPNYFTFIKKPMDLGTMKQKLSLHQYS